ncbi:translation initiation factor IF-2-like [Lutra lutra]|uniref:translation initiation factor IF-2-like n=1 Tax=Lutra lutra TaxID=9657 RepID=UPI001FD23ADC|nr:translation initiation factor IF-2-like [Lutra lutra]
MAPRPRRSLWPRLQQPPRRRPEARGKVSGFGGGGEPAPRGGGGASSRFPLLASLLCSAHLPPRAALFFPPAPAPPGLARLGFPGAPPWTSGSPPRDAVLPLPSRPPRPRGVREPRGGGEVRGMGRGQIPAAKVPASACRPGPSGMTWAAPEGPFNSPRPHPQEGDRSVRRDEDWGAGFEGRGQTAFGELFPETIRNPARFLRPP